MTEWDPELYKWEQVAQTIADRIAAGALLPGDVLSEVAYEAEFGVSRGTIRHAIRALREGGLVVTKPGKGSIVRARPEAGDILD